MATLQQDIILKLVTTKDGDIEDVPFKKGDTVTVVQAWDDFYLVKDGNGHYYNVHKDKIAV